MNPRSVSLWGPVIAYMAAIFVVSSLSHPPLPPGVSDKSGHTVAYAALAVLVVRALNGGLSKRPTGRAVAAGILITALYGATDELHQWFVPGRASEWFDWTADAAGAAIGAMASWAWGIIATRPAPPPRASRHEL